MCSGWSVKSEAGGVEHRGGNDMQEQGRERERESDLA